MTHRNPHPTRAQHLLAREWQPSGFFVLRTPLLPWDTLEAWSAGLGAARAEPDALDEQLEADRRLLRQRLRDLLAWPAISEAIFVAAPALHGRMQDWLRDPGAARDPKLEGPLVRYLARMAGRPTPFGLFAGWSAGEVGGQTALAIGSRENLVRYSRLDMEYLGALCAALAADPEIRPHLRYRPNGSLFSAAGRWRYVERRNRGRLDVYQSAAVEADAPLATVLQAARPGATIAELCDQLCESDSELTLEEAREYVLELIEADLLGPDLEPTLTGPDPIDSLLAQLEAKQLDAVARALGACREQLRQLDGARPGENAARYAAIAESLSALPVPVDAARLFQVDMAKPAPGLRLGDSVVAELRRAIGVMNRLRSSTDPSLAAFQREFLQRYDDREVPLLEALDDEIGIGFGGAASPGAALSPLVRGLALAAPARAAAVLWTRREQGLLRRLTETHWRHPAELVLSDRDIDEMTRGEPDPTPLPDAFATIARLSASDAAAVEQGDFQLCFEASAGPSGIHLLGRFCHMDRPLCDWVRRHVEAEQACRPDAIFAEIVHLPQRRVGNVTARPVLRDYEIVYLGRSGAPDDKQIPVHDLWLSVREGRLVLRSARLQREVVPRLASAHNFASADLPVYRFLGALQRAERTLGTSWDWGALRSIRFLPRVRHGRVILSLAQWSLDATDLERLRTPGDNQAFRAVQTLRAELAWPRHVTLADGDNLLPVDLDNALSVEALLQVLKTRDAALMVEMFPEPRSLCVQGAEGRFVQEIIVPWQREPSRGAQRALAPLAPIPRYHPAGEWLYAKIYADPSTADTILAQALAPALEDALAAGWAERWFFVRYADPEPHLRFRAQGPRASLWGDFLPRLEQRLRPFLKSSEVTRFVLETFEPEVNRYGGPAASGYAVDIFCADSRAVLAALPGLGDGEERFQFGLLGTHRLLSDLGLEPEQAAELMERLRTGYAREFGASRALERQLGDRFRERRLELEGLIEGSRPCPRAEVLDQRRERLRPPVQALRQLEARGALPLTLEKLAESYVHMFNNRVFRTFARAHELCVYDFLARLYSGQLARARRTSSEPKTPKAPAAARPAVTQAQLAAPTSGRSS